MKKTIVLASCLFISVIGFSQTAESTTSEQKAKASCDKGKPACCAHAKKSCGDKSKASASADTQEMKNSPSLKATEPKESTTATAKSDTNP